MMDKTLILFFVGLIAVNALIKCTEGENCPLSQASEGTESYFFSPYGLGRTPDMPWALQKLRGQIKVRRTTSNISSINYIIDNLTLDMAYNYNSQQTTIFSYDQVKISGGILQFTYKFNYAKTENGNTVTGQAYGYVFSDPITYVKEPYFCVGFICWRLTPNKGADTVTIDKNKMSINRLDPFNQTDLENLQKMLDGTTVKIDPSNIKSQILEAFNQLFPVALNNSLDNEAFNQVINYTYSNTYGEITMEIFHYLYGLSIDPVQGYNIVFVTNIKGWDEPVCNMTVPLTHASFSLYGGTQTYHLNCLYESVVKYLQSKGWLDTKLDKELWEVDDFHFYAGDLYDLIKNLQLTFDSKEILDGYCVAQKEGLSFVSSREIDSNSYVLATTYKCSLKGNNKNGTTTQVMKFTAKVKLYIAPAATTNSLSFKIRNAIIDDLSFEQVGNYFVNNLDLALEKATKVIQKVVNTFTFGTNYPTVVRKSPQTRVDRDWVFYYDSQHLERSENMKTEQSA